ncbi:nucleotide exchange factor GrpE [Lacticaseibacillus sharpeae]|uniref:Protein GrpE n=1 Tax=Lacticaseibacillus sharpeae JCM 1186 = DSM 20505 TaxID=1291052 RepID=A0A0R1ZXA5_9LACO|nr:nucleotide exchange factor GrpE [Lacticaseibacillus sharpeae]KRM55715.1 molecular chaperone GrpE (heat shock protein) [Lacticaseibacillus sharpeae JCM 1186 = DSM 20505]
MVKHESKSTDNGVDELAQLKAEISANSLRDLEALSSETTQEAASLKKERDQFEDKYLRAEAEMRNMNARFKKEREQLLHFDGQKVITSILPVLDNLDRALQSEVNDDGAAQLKKGVQMVFEHMQTALKEAGVTEVGVAGQKFDPTVHQAVQTVAADADHSKDTIVTVYQKGYKLHERVLRPAMVVVAN